MSEQRDALDRMWKEIDFLKTVKNPIVFDPNYDEGGKMQAELEAELLALQQEAQAMIALMGEPNA
jgi:hypothetical protein